MYHWHDPFVNNILRARLAGCARVGYRGCVGAEHRDAAVVCYFDLSASKRPATSSAPNAQLPPFFLAVGPTATGCGAVTVYWCGAATKVD